jgi:glycosyltransferase involved in cell wall biosynthesis
VNVYYLTFSPIPSARANSIQVMQMCQAFSRGSDQVSLFCRHGESDRGEVFEFYGVEPRFAVHAVRTPQARFLNRLWYAARVTFALRGRETRPGVVYCRDRLTAGLVALVHRRRYPIVLEVHAPPGSAFWEWWIARLVARPGFARLVAISDALARDYLARFPGLSPDKVMVAHDGANDLALGGDDTAPPVEHRRLRVGYVGSLRPGKGMEIISRLAPLVPECDFVVVGGDAEVVQSWRREADYPNLEFRGFVEPARADACIGEFDIVLAPYQPRVMVGDNDLDISAWMSPLKLFEYMRRCKPIIASDLPVLREVLRDGENALLVAPTDPEAWRAAILRLLHDAGLRQALGKSARRDFREHYTWERRAEKVLAGLTPPGD